MKQTLPCKILCEHAGGFRAALLFHWGPWLPAELSPEYAAIIGTLRSARRRLVQTTNFQGNAGATAVRRLFRQVLATADARDATDVITIVSPHDARAYCAIWGFEDLRPAEDDLTWPLARDVEGALLPTRLIRLRLDAVPEAKRNRL